MVVERIAEGGGFSGGLGCMVVANRLYGFSELTEGVGHARVRFGLGEGEEADAEFGFGEANAWGKGVSGADFRLGFVPRRGEQDVNVWSGKLG